MNSKLTLVFLPGVGFSKSLWRKMFPLFAEYGDNLVAVDLPYYGTKYGHENLTFDNYLFLLEDVWIKEKLTDRDVVLVGHSFGAFLSLRFTSLFGDRVKGLVLISAPLLADPKFFPRKLAFVINTAYHSKWLSERIRLAALRIDHFLEVAFHKPNTLKGLCTPNAFWKKGKVWNIAYCFHDLFFVENFVEESIRVRIPVLLTYGLKDSWFFEVQGDSAYKYFPNKKIVAIDANHSIPLNQPEILATEIKKYIADLHLD